MTKRCNRKNRKAQSKPYYTKYTGYKTVREIIKGSKKQLVDVAHIVNLFAQCDKKEMTTGEILKGTDAVKSIAAHATEIKDALVALETNFLAVETCAQKSKIQPEDFTDLVGQAMGFLALFTERVVGPMADIAESLERVAPTIPVEKETEHVE